MSAPLVVNTTDGTAWTRRKAERDGQALYAPAKCPGACPEFVMASFAELAERGIAGTADVLPVPVGPEPQADPVAAGRSLDLLALMDERAASVVSPVLASVLDEAERLRARVAELEAERHSTNAALDGVVQELRGREARLAVANGHAPFEYVDAHNHRIILNNKTTDALDQAYAWLQADDLAIGGAMVNVWLPVEQARALDRHLDAQIAYEFTDHTGDTITVAPAEDWTVFTFTRCLDDEDDQEPTSVRVVVLTARVPRLRAALSLLCAEAGER